MTPEQWAERTAVAQGLPPRVTDPGCLTAIARLIVDRRDRETGYRPAVKAISLDDNSLIRLEFP